jgi:hypothetical protein
MEAHFGMPSTTPIVPSTGTLRLIDIQLAFPSRPKPGRLSTYLGRHSQLPAEGSLRFSHFRGLTAPMPTHALQAKTGTIVSIDSNGLCSGQLTGNASISYNLREYCTDIELNEPEGEDIVYTTQDALPAGVSLTNGLVQVALTTSQHTAGVTKNVSITCTNPYGNSVSIPMSFRFDPGFKIKNAADQWWYANENNEIRLGTEAQASRFTVEERPDMYKLTDPTRDGVLLLVEGQISKAVRHGGLVMWAHEYVPNNFDYVWDLLGDVLSGEPLQISNDFGNWEGAGYRVGISDSDNVRVSIASPQTHPELIKSWTFVAA